jgi:hypothetical protein
LASEALRTQAVALSQQLVGLATRVPEKGESLVKRQEGIDLKVYARVANGKLALLRDATPPKYTDALDAIGTFDRPDVVDVLYRGELSCHDFFSSRYLCDVFRTFHM